MKRKRDRRIAYSNLPPPSPLRVVWVGAIVWLVMDRVGASPFAFGVAYAFFAVTLIAAVVTSWQYEGVDLLGKDAEP